MNKRNFLIAVLLLCCGCQIYPSKIELLEKGTKTFEIVDIKQPKHYYLSLRDVVTDQTFSKIYVAKRFYDWEKLPVGTKLELSFERWKFDDGSEKTLFPELKQELETFLKKVE